MGVFFKNSIKREHVKIVKPEKLVKPHADTIFDFTTKYKDLNHSKVKTGFGSE